MQTEKPERMRVGGNLTEGSAVHEKETSAAGATPEEASRARGQLYVEWTWVC